MLDLYVEALLADEELADQVWYLWDAGLIPDEVAAWAWWLVRILDQARRMHDLPDP